MTRSLKLSLLALAPALVVAGCGEQANEAPPATDAPASPAASGASIAGEQSPPIMLDTLAEDDLAGFELGGELACAFTFARGDEPLLLAASTVDPQAGGEAAVEVDGTVMRLEMDGTGGFAALSDGGSFSNGALNASVAILDQAPLAEEPQAAMESPLKRARLTIARGSRQIAIDGFYECGP